MALMYAAMEHAGHEYEHDTSNHTEKSCNNETGVT